MWKTKRQRNQIIMWAAITAAAAGLFFLSTELMAAELDRPAAQFDGLMDLIQSRAGNWDQTLRRYAERMFWILAAIQFVWTFFPMLFRQSDLGELFGELIRFVLVIGFFYALLQFSAEWADTLIQSFRKAAADAAMLGGQELRPSGVFKQGADLTWKVMNVHTINPLLAVAVSLAAILILLSFTFIAAFMALTLIESYVVINASVLFMGFGGSQWTREYAIAIIRYAVAVGAKLFTLTLIVSLITDSAKDWADAYESSSASMWTMVGLAFTCAYLAKTIPELIAGMISGTSMGGGHHIGGMAAAAAAGAAAGIAAVSTGGASLAAGTAMKAAGTAAGSTTGGGAAGSGGLAQLINQSLMGGAGAPGAAASSGAGAASNPAAAMPTPRIGGGGPGVSAAPSPQGSSGTAVATTAPGKPAGGSSAPGGSSTAGLMARGAVRTAGVMASMSVPGMDSAASLSVGSPPPGGAGGGNADDASDLPYASVPESRAPAENNFIRPAGPAPEREPPPAPKA